MSVLTLMGGCSYIVNDLTVTNPGENVYEFDTCFSKNIPGSISDLFPTPTIGNTIYLSNGNYMKITNVSGDSYRVGIFLSDTTLLGTFTANNTYYDEPGSCTLGFQINTNKFCATECIYREDSAHTADPRTPVMGLEYQNWQNNSEFPDATYFYHCRQCGDLTEWVNGSFSEDIYFPGEESNSGGGTGSFDDTSDDIDFPSVPTLSATSAGFITLYAPTVAQLNSLAEYMWSSSFDLDTFKKLFADPMDAIIGVSIVPVSVPVAGSQTVKIGFVSTGVSMNLAATQYVTVDCGTLTPSEYWGSALDYSPYTKFSIHLPYIGTRELNTDDVMGKTLHVKYNIDVLSGACTAMVKCGDSVLYEFSGACSTSIPVTGQNWSQLITSCIQLAGAGIAVAATSGSAAGLLPSTANAVMAMKPNIQRTGAVSGSAGMLGVQHPYLIWELPRQSLANNYNTFVGYPSNITALLSTLTGYTQIESVHLENISATQTELAEIETLLKEGVII